MDNLAELVASHQLKSTQRQEVEVKKLEAEAQVKVFQEELQVIDGELVKIKSDLLTVLSPTVQLPIPKVRKPRTPSISSEEEGGGASTSKGGTTLKSIIVNQILAANSQQGLALKDIVQEVLTLITAGKYETKASSRPGGVSQVVSQALHHLKKEKLVATKPGTRLYVLHSDS